MRSASRYMAVFGTCSFSTRSSLASVKHARSSAASSRQGHRLRGWQWWSTASTPSHRVSRLSRGSVLKAVRLVLEDVVFCGENLDVELLYRDVGRAQALAQRVEQHAVGLQVVDGVPEAARVSNGADGGPGIW